MKEYLKILTQSKLFTGIRGTELDAILNCLAPTKNNFKKGAYIFRDGEQISSMGLVLRGSVHILKEDYWGNRTILAEVQTGQLFGEAYACSETAKVSVNAVSVQESAILFFDVRRILSPCSAGCPFHVQMCIRDSVCTVFRLIRCNHQSGNGNRRGPDVCYSYI